MPNTKFVFFLLRSETDRRNDSRFHRFPSYVLLHVVKDLMPKSGANRVSEIKDSLATKIYIWLVKTSAPYGLGAHRRLSKRAVTLLVQLQKTELENVQLLQEFQQ